MRRGVILVHVLILVAMMGFMSALTLKWTMARHVAAKQSVEGNENRALLAAAQAKVFTCLAKDPNFPTGNCSAPSLAGCLGALNIGNRLFSVKVCKPPPPALPPPCRVLISVCAIGDAACPTPPCS